MEMRKEYEKNVDVDNALCRELIELKSTIERLDGNA
jgi:hypothetical protein